jgi:AcrR family transcriptional regulator
MDEGSATSTPRRGRPRDPAIEEAVMRATTNRLAADGYTRMTIADVAEDAGVTRPTIYRRWPGKRELVTAALDFRFRQEQATRPPLDLDGMSAIEAVKAALRRLIPAREADRVVPLIGSVLVEDLHTPELIQIFREHAMAPRVQIFADTLRALQKRGDLKLALDVDLISTLCFGTYLADHLRYGKGDKDLADRVVDTLWPALAECSPGRNCTRGTS